MSHHRVSLNSSTSLLRLLYCLLGAMIITAGPTGCSRNSKTDTPATRPIPDTDEEAPVSSDTVTDTTQPTTAPATQPVLKSEYDPKPPYTVKLYVRDPEEKQPGWLKIMELADGSRLATSIGNFPERNRIYVDTENVHRIRIHIDQLPLAPRRTILRIDDQPMEIVRSRERKYVHLERQPNGAWETVPAPQGEE